MYQHPLIDRLDYSWRNNCRNVFESDDMAKLLDYIESQYSKFEMCPTDKMDVFKAFEMPMDEVKVVICGQDPYHKKGVSTGLAFESSKKSIVPPPLKNIFKEVKSDLGVDFKDRGDLSKWTNQGVMLLNKALITRVGKQNHYWDRFDWFFSKVIETLCYNRSHLVFMLWGKSASFMSRHVDTSRHLILKAPHPSPMSARKGFFGCKHFSQANSYIEQHYGRVIDWTLQSS